MENIGGKKIEEMPEVAHLAKNSVKDVHMRGEIDPGRSVIRELLVGLPLIVESVQLYPHIWRMTFPVRITAVILIRRHSKAFIALYFLSYCLIFKYSFQRFDSQHDKSSPFTFCIFNLALNSIFSINTQPICSLRIFV